MDKLSASRPADRTLLRLMVQSLLAISLISTSGCSDYWWTRGQPPSIDQLLARSQEKLEDSRSRFAARRPEVNAIAGALQGTLTQTLGQLDTQESSAHMADSLSQAEQEFVKLEGRVSVGSRAALAELSGQLRTLTQSARDGRQIPKPTLGLFASRTFSFLANELSVPAPTI